MVKNVSERKKLFLSANFLFGADTRLWQKVEFSAVALQRFIHLLPHVALPISEAVGV